MNSYGKKAVSILLLLVMLCTITAMAAAEGESNSNTESGVVVVLTCGCFNPGRYDRRIDVWNGNKHAFQRCRNRQPAGRKRTGCEQRPGHLRHRENDGIRCLRHDERDGTGRSKHDRDSRGPNSDGTSHGGSDGGGTNPHAIAEPECCAAAGEHRASDGYQASDG